MTFIGYDVELRGFNEQLQKLKDADAIQDRYIMPAMQRAVIDTQSAIVPLVPVGVSARLKNSIGSEVLREGVGSVIGRVGSSLKNEVYPLVQEFGMPPGTFPPSDALVRWVHLKVQPGLENERSVAFLIARRIFKYGIKGKFFMKTGFEKVKDRVLIYFNEALQKIVEELSINGH